jgi:RNA polymerase sigma factor (TIGR02999 family)
LANIFASSVESHSGGKSGHRNENKFAFVEKSANFRASGGITFLTERINLAALWQGFAKGDAASRDQLLSLYYDEFRRIARRVLNGDSSRMHLQPTDLVHEASIRIIKSSGIEIRDQTHFLSLAARVMRMTLIDEVRKHKAAKRGTVMTLWDDVVPQAPAFDIEEFDGVLDSLAQIEPEGAKIVELRFYAGLTLPEISTALDISESTVQRRWRSARAWMFKELQEAA